MSGVAGGRQAVNELQVFLRALSEAQRRWAKRIAAQEVKVRRLMILEDSYRKKLRKGVLRSTNEHLKHLVTTDLLGSMEVKLPPRAAFNAFHFPSTQISGFSVFAMARLCASQVLLSGIQQITLMADLLGAWEILPPSKKEQYESYARILRQKSSDDDHGANSPQEPTETLTAQTGDHKGDVDATWEECAYNNFFLEGRRQLESLLGNMQDKDWQLVAQNEWSSLTLKQKRRYLMHQ